MQHGLADGSGQLTRGEQLFLVLGVAPFGGATPPLEAFLVSGQRHIVCGEALLVGSARQVPSCALDVAGDVAGGNCGGCVP
jgi:hypothetical protein